MITYNEMEDPHKTLDQMCVILKARMSNEKAVERYEHRSTHYNELWESFTNDVWEASPYNKKKEEGDK